uniref:NADH-ubiquinone oxidoreductase chain 6 n=1 Tax=Phobaeticus serratipes TaxID=590988 RepID=E2RV06_9NEOP|nr:NADH dehydrogenase subunit 6 [Phobaeticus serratipes]BAJ24540.1 NADH dehydrogenase subunit 6 [Phobaeticus serratipes]
MNMMMNMTFLTLKHPLSMGAVIIMQTTLISMITGMMYKSFWFSYILFLMYVGGMMVLFIYMTSLIPNMMFSMSSKKMLLLLLLMMSTFFMQKSSTIINNDMMMFTSNKLILMKMYNMPVNIMMIMMVMYLLFTMITVFNIMESNQNPLRMMYN